MRRAQLIIAAVCILVGLYLIGVQPWIDHVTAPSQRVHSLMRAALPGGELAIVVLPARTGHDGEVVLWWVGKDAPQVRPLLRLPGAPAQTTPLPEPRSGEVST
jgi:hypothetical protein